MTQDEIIEMAIQGHASTRDAIRWAMRQEREACAKVCEDNATDLSEGDWDSACINCADHIRERGEA